MEVWVVEKRVHGDVWTVLLSTAEEKEAVFFAKGRGADYRVIRYTPSSAAMTTTNNTPLTAADLDELERLEAAATPGEWEPETQWIYRPFDADDYFAVAPNGEGAGKHDNGKRVGSPETDANAALIAAARNALPRLITMARDSLQDPLSYLKIIERSAELGLTTTKALLAQCRAEVERDEALEKVREWAAGINELEGEREKDAGKIAEYEQLRDENDRYLEALKSVAVTQAKTILSYICDEIPATTVVGGLTFRVTRNDAGDLVAEEVAK